MAKKEQLTFRDRLYGSPEGKITLIQSPNLPIIGWLLFSIIHRIFPDGSVGDISKILAFGCLFVWGWLELFDGTNYIRRGLGLLILILSVMNQV